MATRHIVFALVLGIVVGVAMQSVLGGSLLIHIGTACIGALAAAWVLGRNRA